MALPITIAISGFLAIILGILILVFPKLLRWGLGLYLILFGILQILRETISLSP